MKELQILFFFLLLLLLLLSLTPLFAQTSMSAGETRERQMWADIKTQNWKAVEAKIALDFQSVHPDGARTRDQEITLIKNLNLKGDLVFSDFKVTEHGGYDRGVVHDCSSGND